MSMRVSDPERNIHRKQPEVSYSKRRYRTWNSGKKFALICANVVENGRLGLELCWARSQTKDRAVRSVV